MGRFERRKSNRAESVFIGLMKALHLDSKPLSFQANIFGEVLLVFLFISVFGVSVFVYITNLLIFLGNLAISFFSDKEILPYLSTETSKDVPFCFWCLVIATLACPIIVHVLDGFKNCKRKRNC